MKIINKVNKLIDRLVFGKSYVTSEMLDKVLKNSGGIDNKPYNLSGARLERLDFSGCSISDVKFDFSSPRMIHGKKSTLTDCRSNNKTDLIDTKITLTYNGKEL